MSKTPKTDIMLHGVLRMPTDMWSNDPLDMYQRHTRYIQASDRIIELENKLAAIESVQVPEEPESVRYLRECVVARTRGESTLQYIDILRDMLRRETYRGDYHLKGNLHEQSRAEAAEAKLAAMLKLGEEPSEEMMTAAYHRCGDVTWNQAKGIFAAMFAKLIEQAGVKK